MVCRHHPRQGDQIGSDVACGVAGPVRPIELNGFAVVSLSDLISARTTTVTRIDFQPGQEKRVDKATLEMEPEYPARYFDDLATDLCTSKRDIE